MELKGKRVVVVGIGESGLKAARFLAARGAEVIVNDMKRETELKEALAEIRDLNLEKVLGSHPDDLFLSAELIVTSPGVPRDIPPFKKALERGIPVISELEMAFRFLDMPVVAVSGTNGKTTVTTLLGDIFRRVYGDKVFVGGNIGNPLTELLISGAAAEVVVCEVSSFQLEFINSFKPRVAVMLNISDDHLDRYRDMRDYAEVKSWLFRYQDEKDFALLNAADPIVAQMAENIAARIVWFGDEKRTPGIFAGGKQIIFRDLEGAEKILDISGFRLPGKHNLENLLAAAGAALLMGVPPKAVEDAAAEFKGLPHRMEFIAEKEGVKYYNDSKGTNIGAVREAVQSFDSSVILLMGGLAKGCRFNALNQVFRGKVKAVIAFGESRDQIAKELSESGNLEMKKAADLEQALKSAQDMAHPGDTILLSPGCASFDQFKDYKHRGDTFRRLVTGK